MSDHPELYYWLYLLAPALIVFWFVCFREKKMTLLRFATHLAVAWVTYFVLWTMGFYQLLIFPLFLAIFCYFLSVVFSSRWPEKIVAGAMLLLFLASWKFAHDERARYGAYWELSREHHDGSLSWLSNAARAGRFNKEQIRRYLNSEDQLVRHNAREIAVSMGAEEKEDQQDEVRKFYEELAQLDQDLAIRYLEAVPWAFSEDWSRDLLTKRPVRSK